MCKDRVSVGYNNKSRWMGAPLTKCVSPLIQVVSTAEGTALARSLGVEFYETCAATGLNVNAAFEAVIKAVSQMQSSFCGAGQACT